MSITEAIDLVAFKHALFEGKVEFDYDKVDKSTGKRTPRHAHGTMNEALIPKAEPIVAKFDVEVDTWAESGNTPKRRKFKVCVTQPEIDEWGEDAMDDVVRAAIEKKFCHDVEEFSYWPIDMAYDETPRKMPDDSVFYYDLDKKGFRSFKLANLKGWKTC